MNYIKKMTFIAGVLCIIFFLLSTELLMAQEPGSEPMGFNSIELPPSPNAGAIVEYGEYPPSQSSGTLGITVPITVVSIGNIQVPVVLNYNTGGIRVAEQPGWTGLGWSLDAGGTITRTVRGKADEYYYLLNSTKTPTYESVHYSFQQDISQGYEFVKRNVDGHTDYEPDMFSFNFGGHSGTFYISSSGNVELFPPQDLKIMPYFTEGWPKDIIGFDVYDNTGLYYRFGEYDGETAYEESSPIFIGSGDNPQALPYRSAWYLLRIIDPLTDSKVNFSYASHSDIAGAPQEVSTSYSSTETWTKAVNQNHYYCTSPEEETTLTTVCNSLYIDSITWNKEYIKFHASSTAFPSLAVKLDSIVYANYIDDQQRTFAFEYIDLNTIRFKPETLTITSPSTDDARKYKFEYDNEQKLPERSSHAIDHWGYYNGASNSQSLIPKIFNEYIDAHRNSGNRTANADFSGREMLKSITYPTGGKTTFTFESNTYMRPATMEDITVYPDKSEDVVSNSMGIVDELDISYEFDDPTMEYYNFVLHGKLRGNFNGPDPVVGEVKLKVNGVTVDSFEVTEDHIDTTTDVVINDPYNDIIIISAELTSGIPGDDSTRGFLTWESYDSDDLLDSVEQDAGGRRIKMIENFDPLLSLTTFKEYNYMESGYLTSTEIPQYYSNMQKEHCPDTPPPQGSNDYNENYIILNSSSLRGLGTVAYTHIREYSGTALTNLGYTDHYFWEKKDRPTYGPPYLPVVNYSWLRAKKSKDVIFSNKGDVYDTVKTIKYDYGLDTTKSSIIRGFKSSRKKQIVPRPDEYCFLEVLYQEDQFVYSDYTLETNKYNLKRKTIVDYTPTGKIANVENYFYENPFNSEITRLVKTTSDGKEEKTILTYPGDYVTDCYEPCLENYKDNIEACSQGIDNCYDQLGPCWDKFTDCNKALLDCKKQFDDWYSNSYCTKFGTIILGCGDKKYRDDFHCETSLEDCYTANNYFGCLDSAECGVSSCYDSSFLAYQKCKFNILDCVVTKYENTTNPDSAAIFLLYLASAQNKPVEKKKYVDNELIEHIKYNYRIFDDNDTAALLSSVDTKYNNQNDFTREIVYEKYKKNLPVRLNQKNPQQHSTYLWDTITRKLIGFVKNATEEKCFYESFENNPAGTVFNESGINMAKTGVRVLQGSEYSFPSTFNPGQGVLMSYWYYNGENWMFKEEPFNSNISVISGCQYLDEIRAYPEGSEMMTYCYDGFGNLISSTDQNGLTTTYEYDELGRLTIVRDHEKNIVKHFKYNYSYE